MAKIRFTLPAKPVAPSIARGTLGPLQHQLPEDAFHALQLLVTELVTNSLRHARFRRDDAIDIRVEMDGQRTRVSVCDPGGASQPQLLERDLESTRGRGLFLVDAMSDRWGVDRNDRTCVWFEITPNGAA